MRFSEWNYIYFHKIETGEAEVERQKYRKKQMEKSKEKFSESQEECFKNQQLTVCNTTQQRKIREKSNGFINIC